MAKLSNLNNAKQSMSIWKRMFTLSAHWEDKVLLIVDVFF